MDLKSLTLCQSSVVETTTIMPVVFDDAAARITIGLGY